MFDLILTAQNIIICFFRNLVPVLTLNSQQIDNLTVHFKRVFQA